SPIRKGCRNDHLGRRVTIGEAASSRRRSAGKLPRLQRCRVGFPLRAIKRPEKHLGEEADLSRRGRDLGMIQPERPEQSAAMTEESLKLVVRLCGGNAHARRLERVDAALEKLDLRMGLAQPKAELDQLEMALEQLRRLAGGECLARNE